MSTLVISFCPKFWMFMEGVTEVLQVASTSATDLKLTSFALSSPVMVGYVPLPLGISCVVSETNTTTSSSPTSTAIPLLSAGIV